MRHHRLVQALVVLAVIAAGSTASAAEPEVVKAELGVPFVLVVGETGRVEPMGLEVTLRSASEGAGCFAPHDCSLAMFQGTIATRLGREKNLTWVHAVLEPDETASLDFAGYEIRFGTVRRFSRVHVQATFTVTEKREEEGEE